MAGLEWQDAVFRTVSLPLPMPNAPSEAFRQRLIELPYLMYAVDRLADGRSICLATLKPGSWQVWVYDARCRQRWRFTSWDLHGNIKLRPAHDQQVRLAAALYATRAGRGRADLLKMLSPLDDDIGSDGHPAELLMAVQRWLGEPTPIMVPDLGDPPDFSSTKQKELPYTHRGAYPGEAILVPAPQSWPAVVWSRSDVGTEQLPVLAYTVERLSDDREVCITKPGGKTVHEQSSELHDFLVWTYDKAQNRCSFMTHPGTKADVRRKLAMSREIGESLIRAIRHVCDGEEPSEALQSLPPAPPMIGESPELILKNYKWIFGQEDCNYPPSSKNLKGRWLFMEELEALLKS